MQTLRYFGLISVMFLACCSFATASSPEWLRQAARAPLPTYPDDVRGVRIYSEQVTRILDSGEIRTSHRIGYKILRTTGRDLGKILVHFDKETKLTSLTGWSIPAKGSEYEIKEKEAIETTMFDGILFEDTRYKILRLPEADPGTVVGFEYEQRHRPFSLEDVWHFQEDVPVRKSRYTLILPSGWEMRANWLNHAEVPAQVSGSQYIWELNDVPEVKYEWRMPTRRSLSGRLSVIFFPPSAGRTATHSSWNEVGAWYAQLVASRRQPTPEIKQKVIDLTKNSKSLLEKVRILGAFAQRDVRYVAIEIGIGGYQPHSAQEVFTNRYGDCKDKATLLSTMLREIGVESYYVLAHTERGFVAPSFPTMNSFNHAILAIRLPDSIGSTDALYSVVDHKTLGKLLIFDPTSSMTPLGYLPPTLQSNRGLLITEQGGELVDFPLQVPNSNTLVRVGKLQLSSDGVLSGEVKEVRTGVSAIDYRAELLAMQAPQRVQKMESFLSTFLTGFTLREYKVENLEDFDKELVVNYSFVAMNYAKTVGGLLLIRPRIFGSKAEGLIDLKERKYPVEMEATAIHSDEFNITLPMGFTVDELPAPVKIVSGPISYSSESVLNGTTLKYNRQYKVEQVMVPLEGLEELNRVNRKIAQDERNSAVLKRQP